MPLPEVYALHSMVDLDLFSAAYMWMHMAEHAVVHSMVSLEYA